MLARVRQWLLDVASWIWDRVYTPSPERLAMESQATQALRDAHKGVGGSSALHSLYRASVETSVRPDLTPEERAFWRKQADRDHAAWIASGGET